MLVTKRLLWSITALGRFSMRGTEMWGTKYPVRVYFEHFLMLQVCRVFMLLAWVDSLGCTAVLLRCIRMWGERGSRKGAAITAHEDV